jgi:drug/metabolite transporter (DMT)-like permease
MVATRHFGTLVGLAAIGLWSTTVAFARSLSEQVGPVTGAAAVYLIAGTVAVIGPLASPSHRRELRQLPRRYLLGCGVLFVVNMLALFVGVGLASSRQEALEISLLNYLWPPLTILFSLWLLRQTATWWLLPGTILALVGTWLSLTQQSSLDLAKLFARMRGNPLSYAGGLTAAVTWALYNNLTRRWAGKARRGGVALFLPATGVILLLLCLPLREAGHWTTQAAVEATLLGLMTAAGYTLWDIAMRRGDFTITAASSYLTPFLSTMVTCIYLSVVPSPKLWLGCVLIVAGSLLSRQAVSARRTQHTAIPTAPLARN